MDNLKLRGVFIDCKKGGKIFDDAGYDHHDVECTISFIRGKIIGIIYGSTNGLNEREELYPESETDENNKKLWYKYLFYATDEEYEQIKKMIFNNKLYPKIVTLFKEIKEKV